MKKPIIIIILLLANIFGYAQGVDVYRGGDIYKALQFARNQRKLLLVEFYAKWEYRSSWFNNMMNNSKEVQQFLNENFVVYQFDTETKTGADFANRYSVNNYPNLLVFNQNGDVIHKIDKALEPQDFIETLNSSLLQQNGSVVWKITQLDNAIQNQDQAKADEVFEQLYNSVGDDIFNKFYWRFFENNTVTFIFSNAYNVLINNSDKFQSDSVIVQNRISDIVNELILPILLESQPYDSLVIELAKEEVAKLKIANRQTYLIVNCIEERRNGNINKFLDNFTQLINSIDEDKGYNITLALDYVAKYGSKEQKNRAKKIVDAQLQKVPRGSQTQILEHLLNKF